MNIFRRHRVPYSVTLRTAAKLPQSPELERRQEIARRILVEEGGNVDKPISRRLVQENPDTFIVPPFIDELPIG